MLEVGVKDKRFINSFVVNFSIDFNYFDAEISNLLSNLFNQAVKEFEPFWACMTNCSLQNDAEYLDENNKPTSIHWLNYWSPAILQTIDKRKLKKLERKYKYLIFNRGFLKLQDIAINATNSSDIEYIKSIENDIL